MNNLLAALAIFPVMVESLQRRIDAQRKIKNLATASTKYNKANDRINALEFAGRKMAEARRLLEEANTIIESR
jgi:hypothetical protein